MLLQLESNGYGYVVYPDQVVWMGLLSCSSLHPGVNLQGNARHGNRQFIVFMSLIKFLKVTILLTTSFKEI